MNLAVLLYQYVSEKPSGIPDVWPAEVIELGESTDLPGEDWQLMTYEDYQDYRATHQSTYNSWSTSHYAPAATAAYIDGVLIAAREFGNILINDFSRENVLMGITQAGKTRPVMDYLHKLLHALSVGSLYAAVSICDDVLADNSQTKTDLSPFVTNDRITLYKHKIQDYLGLANT